MLYRRRRMRLEKKEEDYLLQKDIIAKLDNKQTIKGRSSPLERWHNHNFLSSFVFLVLRMGCLFAKVS